MLKKDPFEGYVKPGRMFGNLYFVGTRPASTHVIDTGDGYILIDPAHLESLFLVLHNMWTLGLDPRKIKKILVSHAHHDHSDALNALVKLTGATTYLGHLDLPRARGEAGIHPIIPFEPDVLLHDGDTVTLGNTTVEIRETPGHTPGTISFFFNVTDGTRTLRAGMHGGVGLNTLNSEYLIKAGEPFTRRDQYFASLEKLRAEHVDIHVGNHVGNNDTIGKLKALEEGAAENPFIDESAWGRFLDKCRDKLIALIESEKEAE